MKKKILFASLLLAGLLSAIELKIGASPVPHAQILKIVKEDLKKDGVELVIVPFTDYVTPNLALNDGAIDANYFQHRPYLEKMVKDRGLKIQEIAKIHIEPLGIYSKRFKTLENLKDNARVAIPNDPTNASRALILLHNEGVIKLKDPSNLACTTLDIVENPKRVKIIQMEAPLLPRMLGDVDIAVINGNYALQAGLSHKEALALEDKRSAYANIIAIQEQIPLQKAEAIEKLIKALQTQKVANFINKKYQGEVIPVFEIIEGK